MLLESNSYLHFARLMLEAFPSKAEFSERCQPLELALSSTGTNGCVKSFSQPYVKILKKENFIGSIVVKCKKDLHFEV